MATKTFTVSKQYMATSNTGDANPGDLHVPIGRWTALAWNGRAALYAPVSFTGMTSINEARLYLKAHVPSSGWHAKGTSTATITAQRKSTDWSETTGGVSAAIDETWGGNGTSVVNFAAPQVAGDFANLGSMTNDAWYSIIITGIVQAWFTGSPNYGVLISNATDDTNAAYAKEFYSRHSSGDEPYIWIDYNTNSAPNAPTGLVPTGDATVNAGTAPVIYGVRSDPDTGDYITGVDIIVYKDDGTTQVDQDTYYPTGSPTNFSRTMTLPKANAFYKWKARTRDRNNVWGPYTALQRFKANTTPNPPTTSLVESPTTAVATLTPSFNVTHSDPDSGDTMVAYQVIVEKSDGTAVWDSGTTGVSAGTTSATKLYTGPALDWGVKYQYRARTTDSNGAVGPYSSDKNFTTFSTGKPINLSPTGNIVSSTLTPTLSGARATNDYNITSYRIQLYASNGTTLIWDSGDLTSGITNGATFSKVYNGSALSYGTQYKWQVKNTGNIGGASGYSALQSFTTRSAADVEQTAPLGSPITTLTPTFTGTWPGGTANAVQIIVYAADGTTQIWDSGTLTFTASASFSKVYAGPALAWNTTYQYKVRIRNNADNVFQPYSGLASFTTDFAQQPALTAPISNSWQTTLTPTFTGNSQGGETITQFRIRLYEADGTTLTWDSGDLAGSSTSFSKVYNGANALVAGRSYKWQARYTKSTGPTGNYSAMADFHINSAPLSPSSITPATGGVAIGTLTPSFTATFEDPDQQAWGDYPVQMEIEVRNNATDVLIANQTLTTGLIAGANTMVWDGTPALAYDVTYKWRVRYRDSKSVDGTWSSFNTFKPTQPSSVTITNPVGTLSSPQVPVTWTFSSPSGKPQASYRVRVLLNDDQIPVYDSGTILSASNNHTIPAGYLINGVDYQFELTTVDTDGV